MDFSFPQAEKLNKKYQYDAVRKNGRSKRGLLLRLASLPSIEGTDSKTKYGVIVSRRVGNAVLRNRVKRRLRELYRQERTRIAPGSWVVVIASPQAATASLKALRAEWITLVRKLF